MNNIVLENQVKRFNRTINSPNLLLGQSWFSIMRDEKIMRYRLLLAHSFDELMVNVPRGCVSTSALSFIWSLVGVEFRRHPFL